MPAGDRPRSSTTTTRLRPISSGSRSNAPGCAGRVTDVCRRVSYQVKLVIFRARPPCTSSKSAAVRSTTGRPLASSAKASTSQGSGAAAGAGASGRLRWPKAIKAHVSRAARRRFIPFQCNAGLRRKCVFQQLAAPRANAVGQASAQCHLVLARLRIRQKLWGGQSCPQPPFRRLFRAMSDFVARQGRLKAGCSQDWLPHNLCRIAMASKTKWHWAEGCPTNANTRLAVWWRRRFRLRTVCSLIALSERGPAGRALLPVSADPFTEIVAGKHLIPHVAGDGASLLPTEPPDALHEGHPLLDSRRTESGHHASDFEGPNRRAVAHFVDQAEFARLGGKTDAPGEGKLQRTPLSQGTGDGPVNQEGPEPEADFGEAEAGLRTGHHDVAVGHQPDATPEGRTLDASDERLAEARPNGEEPLVKGVDLLGMRALFDLGQVH